MPEPTGRSPDGTWIAADNTERNAIGTDDGLVVGQRCLTLDAIEIDVCELVAGTVLIPGYAGEIVRTSLNNNVATMGITDAAIRLDNGAPTSADATVDVDTANTPTLSCGQPRPLRRDNAWR